MRASKMHELLEYFSTGDWWIGTKGDELTFEFNSRPHIADHRYLLKKGFVCVDGTYIYRPRKRS